MACCCCCCCLKKSLGNSLTVQGLELCALTDILVFLFPSCHLNSIFLIKWTDDPVKRVHQPLIASRLTGIKPNILITGFTNAML